MKARLLILLAGISLLLFAHGKKEKPMVGTAQGENQDVILKVTLYMDPASVKDQLGTDLGGQFMVADVHFEPKYGKEIAIDRDDFVLRTDKDGEKTTPFAPSEIAGGATLVVPQQRVAGNQGAILYGNVAPQVNGPAVLKNSGTPADLNLEKLLKSKVLPETKTSQPVSGFLYFSLGKQKMKDLEMLYGPPGNGRISLRFKPR
jgi:hypothetical protein